MNDLSTQSERYATIFSRALKLYPARHRQQYGDDMLQLFRDQLAEAEQLNDRYILKETFLHALFGLPGSIIREYFSGKPHAPDSGRLNWTVVSLIFFGFFLSGVYLYSTVVGSYSSSAAGALLIIISWIVAMIASFLTTRRLLLALATLGAGVIAFMLIGFGGSVLEMSFRTALGADQSYYLMRPWFTMALVVVPPLIMYGLAGWFQAFPERFRRNISTNSTPEELRQLGQKIKDRRRLITRWSLALLSVLIAANLVGLYDPPTSHTDLGLPSRQVAETENMHFELDQLNGIKGLIAVTRMREDALPFSDDPGGWQLSEEALALADNGKVVTLYQAAAEKPYFQDPNFADMEEYTTVNKATGADVLVFDGFSVGSGVFLVKAEQLRRKGDMSGSINSVAAVLKVSDAVGSSHGPIITMLASNFVKLQALNVLKLIAESDISGGQRKQIQTIVEELTPPANGIISALKTEYHTTRLFIEAVRSSLWQENGEIGPYGYGYLIPGLLPYTFQPNRTLAMASEKYREQITDLTKPCSEVNTKLANLSEQSSHNPYIFWLSTFKFNGIGQKLAESVYYFDGLQRDRCQIEELTASVLRP